MTTAPAVDPAIEERLRRPRSLLRLHGMDVEETRARLGKPEGQPLPA